MKAQTSIPNHLQGWAASAPKAPLQKTSVPISKLRPQELLLEVVHSGICHSDVHLIDNDWGISSYPLIPGHEIVGRIIAKGDAVPAHYESGRLVGVGWQRAACLECEDCISARDNMCEHSEATCVGHAGGYADYHVTDWHYSFLLPPGLEGPGVAPLLCGGITVYSPLREFVTGGRSRVGIVGVGGLGHLAIKFASALGCEVTVFSSSPSKKKEAEEMGAHHFVASADPKEIKKVGARLDLVLVTANVDLPWPAYLQTLRADGTLCFVGIPPSDLNFNVGLLLGKRRRVAASPIGSRARIQEMLEFCARHKITATVETFALDNVNQAISQVRENRVRYRAVLARP